MKTLTLAISFCLAAPAFAQDAGSLAFCHGDLSQDRQPNFSADGGLTTAAISITSDSPPRLRLNTNANALDPERIILPVDQNLEAMIVNDSAGGGAAHVLGWFYYDELIARGYIDIRDAGNPNDDVLLDLNKNDIPDFHEDLFNIMPPSGAEARPYIGLGPRCPGRTFTVVGNDGGTHVLSEPDLAVQGCASASTYSSTLGPKRWYHPNVRPDGGPVVGSIAVTPSSSSDFSDRGLHPYLPNLLEPADPLNADAGLGHLALLTTNDDSYTCPGAMHPQCLVPVVDKSTLADGLPDYRASAYDSRGVLKAGRSAAEAITEADRKVPIGSVQGNREIVFFFVAYVQQQYGPATDSCFRVNPNGGQCNLWLYSDTNVFFSKTLLNMDLFQGTGAITTKDLGSGWLNASSYALLNTATYGNVTIPAGTMQTVNSYFKRAAHTIVGAPPTDPTKWILGWEDQNQSGDKTYADIVILINKQNNGVVQSGVVSGDLSPTIAQDFTITDVKFTVSDDAYYKAAGYAANWCTAQPTQPKIDYYVALDCKVCTAGCSTNAPTWTVNATPTWYQVPLNASVNGVTRAQTVDIGDFLEKGYTGSQLCWKAQLDSPKEGCEPTVINVDVAYKAKKAGNYARSSIVPLANAVVYGTYELPGKSWYDLSAMNALPSTRLFDSKRDLADRGHLFFKTMYAAGSPNTTNVTLQWDSGDIISDTLTNMSYLPKTTRNLYTLDSTGARAAVSTQGNAMFTDTWCGEEVSAGNYLYDLNRDGVCTPATEKQTLIDWLYGYEKDVSGSVVRRTWPMGGVNLSTPAVVGPPGLPPWLYKVNEVDRQAYLSRFSTLTRIATRATVAYVGTTQGYLHGLASGAYRGGDNPATTVTEYRGYFNGNDYGTGAELFAYLPNRLLKRYIGNYMRWGNKPIGGAVTAPPSGAILDSSPAIADIDLGTGTFTDKTISHPWIDADRWIPTTNPTTGGKTVLVTGTGKGQSVFLSLDITDPADPTYPLPMWELDVKNDVYTLGGSIPASQTLTQLFVNATLAAPVKADLSGSRHSPPVAKLRFNNAPLSTAAEKWTAVFASDYLPTAGTNPTLFFVDMKTGQPVQVAGSTPQAKLAGVVTLGDSGDINVGIGGEPALIDLNDNGVYDIAYVPGTNGKIYRINFNDISASRQLGKVISSCVVANTRTTLAAQGVANTSWQGIYSSMAVQTVKNTGGAPTSVRFYYGTASNPDDNADGADVSATKPNYYVFAWEDLDPTGSCAATLMWNRALGTGQQVWGGVVLSKDTVFTATAVGKAADLCELDEDTSGKTFGFSIPDGGSVTGSGTDLGGHSMTSPVIYDQHLFILSADAKLKVRGQTNWNTQLGGKLPNRTGMIIWDVDRNGRVAP